jgi:adenosylcobinamide-phosphate synthase
MTDHILALAAGLALDLLIGDPEWFPHPVKWIGGFIGCMEKTLRARGGNLRNSAVVLTVSTLALTMAVTASVLWALSRMGRWPLFTGMAVISWLGLSARNLADEGRGVAKALSDGIEAGRARVARIVGRDTAALSEREVICATVETVAENTTDGVVSPLLFAALGGPVLLMGFKACSTLDSMVGYLDPKYRDIGWSSAKLDDILNYIPARLCALLLSAAAAITGLDWKGALRIVKRDHANHLSPNCAWSEAAAAGALGIRLGGTHRYFGKPVEKPTIGDDRRPPERKDILKTVRMMYITAALSMLLIVIAAWVV